ncbi:MAG: bifunctional 2-C-methyl-D-erythritol 4-phosphate cytidylyltransferase/2-C-methyl-D-erythritol 2,4-cyclodiphosphate synthase [Pseudomonadota bacterium]
MTDPHTQPQPASEHQTAALIVAAGRGRRAGGGTPKQYRDLCGRPILSWTLDAFLSHPEIDRVLVVIHPDDEDLYDAACAHLESAHKIGAACYGGASRQASVRLGLERLEPEAPARVLIHDAARPFVDAGVIDRVLESLGHHEATIAALPISDTLKRASDDARPLITDTVPRGDMWRAQTPQGFRYAAILGAHRAVADRDDFTDDAAVAEAAGMPVSLSMGSPNNMKITQAEDFGLAASLLRERSGAPQDAAEGAPEDANSPEEVVMEHRTGQGFDVHAFEDGDKVTLCGVEIPHDAKLSGHSDADVGMHALTDAILGAIGAGDIGDHFPPTDPQWKGAASEIFLKKARDLVRDAGGVLIHADVTLICERPKIGPHRDAMRAALGDILRIAPTRVSVKATTTEKLGFTGRKEGVAALAVATVALPSPGAAP